MIYPNKIWKNNKLYSSWRDNNLYSSLWLLSIFRSIILIFLSVYHGNTSFILELDLRRFSLFPFSVPIVIDFFSIIFRITVLTISSWVALFTTFYIYNEPTRARFIMILILFVAAINLLIFVPRILGIILGWDGLGIISFLLVIYYRSRESLAAGIITALRNRIGDRLFILFLGFNATVFSWHFSDCYLGLFALPILWLLVIGRITKRAQIPFAAWLPAAMAAPTPVSTLVHSSTLVTAGVYVLFRFRESLSGIPLCFLIISSIITLLMAGISATIERDLKKIVALSTLRQLGVILFALSNEIPNLCFFHLITHAFFKATIFLCVGTLIFAGGGVQDYRLSGTSWYKIPVATSWLITCCACLTGIPFTSGFLSKDLIVERCLWNDLSLLVVVYIFFSVILTAIYTARIVYTIAFAKSYNSVESINDHNYIYANTPITGIGLLALFSGTLIQNSTTYCSTYIFIPGTLKNLTLRVVILGLLLRIRIFAIFKKKYMSKNNFLSWFLKKIWFLTEVSGNPIRVYSLSRSIKLYRSIEKSWISIFWTKNLKNIISSTTAGIRKSQNHMLGKIFLLRILSFMVFTLIK